jgi:hypothetical protein
MPPLARTLRPLALALALGLAPLAGAHAQRPHTPAAGTPERRLLMDALRVRLQREIGKPMIFRVVTLRVLGNWAYAEVEPRQPDGSPLDWEGTPFAEERREGVLDTNSVALLRRTQGQWRIVQLAIGPTDVAWIPWEEESGAPHALFPYP